MVKLTCNISGEGSYRKNKSAIFSNSMTTDDIMKLLHQ